MPRPHLLKRLLALLMLCALLVSAAPATSASPAPDLPLPWKLALAYGSSAAPDETWLLLANPGRAPATARLTFYPDGGAPVVTPLVLAPGTRRGVYANPLVPRAAFAVLVEADQPLVVERSIFHNATASSAAATAPAQTWWFARLQSAVGTGRLVVFNPGDSVATLSVAYTLADGTQAKQSATVAPRARVSLDPAGAGSGTATSARVDATQPVVVERVSATSEAGSDALPGATKASKLWYAPAAAVGAGPAHLTVLNPASDPVHLTVDLLATWGPVQRLDLTAKPGAPLDVPLPAQPGDYAVQLQASAGVVVEQSRQQDDGTEIVHPAAPDLGWTWLFAEGVAGGAQPALLRVENPNASVAHLQIRPLDEHGDAPSFPATIAAHAIATLPLADGGSDRPSGAAIVSDVPVAVERIQPITRGGQASATSALGTSPDAIHFQGRDVLGGKFLLLNMPAMLFHDDVNDIREDIRYAQWMNAGVIRVFPTDPITYKPWDGKQVGARIVQIAPDLRAAGLRLIVALVSNYQPVPAEPQGNFGLVDGFYQLLMPFYTQDWRGAYLGFATDLMRTVRDSGATDVIAAWEVGNELHTPTNPPLILDFLRQMSAEMRAIDPLTPMLPGTMGANHLDPWQEASPVARALYCELPFDAYTLHTYDWVGPGRGGDMPIDWDLQNIVNSDCPSGRRLPVLVEELGTTRSVSGLYAAGDEQARLNQELHQLRFVLSFPIVAGVGAWSAESPLTRSAIYYDNGRGLTSYGPRGDGSGSCYPNTPSSAPRCQLEMVLRALPHVP